VRPRRFQQIGAQGFVLEAGRDHHGGPASGFAKLADQLGHARRRRRDDGKVGRGGQRPHVGIGNSRANRRLVRIDRHDRPLESRAEQVARQHLANGAKPVAGADQGNGARLKQRIEIACRHGRSVGPAVYLRPV